jgi:hypothetical protein
VVGGPENSLDRSYYYTTDKDLKYIAERTNNTIVGFVSLFMRYDQLWIYRRVRSINL